MKLNFYTMQIFIRFFARMLRDVEEVSEEVLCPISIFYLSQYQDQI